MAADDEGDAYEQSDDIERRELELAFWNAYYIEQEQAAGDD
jgi:hypothetical protein